MADKVIMSLDKSPHGEYQLSINLVRPNNTGHGYRIFGPKYTGGSHTVIEKELTARDSREIGAYLNIISDRQEDVLERIAEKV